jgi:hypothetical protein
MNDFVADFRDILGTVLVARQPLSSAAIDAFCSGQGTPSCIQFHCSRASCSTVRPFVFYILPSPTFSRQRTGANGRCGFLINPHITETLPSLSAPNGCSPATEHVQHDPFRRPHTERLPEDISYSCLFWIDHICAIEKDATPIVNHMRDFLFRHLLHWFEAMSILRRSRDSISHLDHLLRLDIGQLPHAYLQYWANVLIIYY